MTLRSTALVGAAMLMACPGELGDPAPFLTPGSSACAAVAQQTIAGCATGGCHSSADQIAGLDMERGDFVTFLEGKQGETAGCQDLLLVNGDEPAQSLLYLKLFSDTPCGNRMPLGEAEVSDEAKACFLDALQSQLDPES